MINIAKPNLGKEEEQAVVKALRAGKLAQGEIVKQFEEAFASYVGVKYAVATSNGTSALHTALLAQGLQANDEVITTPFSFIASSNAVLYTGAKPRFVDIDLDTFTINPDLIEKAITKKTKAIIPVHLYGLPAHMGKIINIAKKYNLAVIEDACQAHGAAIKDKLVGSIGTAGCFSFYPTKNMTTGEGGMITTNSKRLADTARIIRSHGMPKKYYHSHLGFNYRMTDTAAAIGIVQLKKLATFNKKRHANASFYMKKLAKVKGLVLPKVPENYMHVFHQFTIRITSDYHMSRKKLIEKLKTNGIIPEVYYPLPIHKQKLYKSMGYADGFKNAEKAANEVLSLPVHPQLTKEDLLKVISALY